MKTDFEQWLAAQFADTGPFTIFIVLVRIADDEVVPLKSSYAHMIGDEMAWREMRGLLDRAAIAWDGVAFFVGLGQAGGPLPDRNVQSNYEGVNALRVGMQKAGFRGREDSMKLIEALEGLEMKESDDCPQGDKTLRKEDHQAFLRQFISEVRGSKYKILATIEKEKTIFPPACKFA